MRGAQFSRDFLTPKLQPLSWDDSRPQRTRNHAKKNSLIFFFCSDKFICQGAPLFGENKTFQAKTDYLYRTTRPMVEHG